MPNFPVMIKAFRELGSSAFLHLLRYQIARRSGWYRLRLQPPSSPFPDSVHPLAFTLPGGESQLSAAPDSERLERLLAGEVQLFGAVHAPLDFKITGPLHYWTHHDLPLEAGRDIKFTWEPARFCWTADLVMAYRHSPDSQLPAFFADRLDEFMRENPPYQGPNWASGQEVALRLMNLALAFGSFGDSLQDFEKTIAIHAWRIPATLAYARAQNNNHLLSEAAGLFTAGRMLRGWGPSHRWLDLGWRTFQEGVLAQFAADGSYTQQSSSYHRLALQLALWVSAVAEEAGMTFRDDVLDRLASATRYLFAVCDPDTGQVPNLGPNDGAYIFPLTWKPSADYRPVLQAASRVFLGVPAFEPGGWDDMSEWLVPVKDPGAGFRAPEETSARVLRHSTLDSRALLRAATFINRPGHADQLHVDIFWRGHYLARDPGTYLYNGDPPWDNPLTAARYHNTLTVDDRDQMTRASRFLYVDRAQAKHLEGSEERLIAEHDGYRSLGLVHRRKLAILPDGWLVEDLLAGKSKGPHRVRLHWLLPDAKWRLEGTVLEIVLNGAVITLSVRLPAGLAGIVGLVRAGEALVGTSALPTEGWYSPTYAVREPALSFSVQLEALPPVKIESRWVLPKAT